MNNDQHPLDKAVKNIIDNYELTPPHYVWSDIQSSLRETKRKRRRATVWYAAASWLIIISFGTGYYFHNQPATNQILASSTSHTMTASESKQDILTAELPKTFNKNNFKANATHNSSVINSQTTPENNTDNAQLQANVISNEQIAVNNSQANSLQIIDSTELVRSLVLAAGGKPIQDSAQTLYLDSYNQILYADASNDMNNWQFGGGATPLFNFGGNTSNQEYTAESRLKDGNNASVSNETQTKPSIYTSGMYVKRSINKMVKLRSGFYYNRIINGTNTTNGVEVPMIGELNVIDGKHLQVSVNSGVGAGMEAQIWYPYGMGGVTIAIPLNNRLHMNVEPMFKHTFTESTIHNNNFLGVFTGVSYSF